MVPAVAPAAPLALSAGTGPALQPLAAAPALVPAGGGSGVVTPDGNGMDLDALMAQLGKSDLDYQAVSRQLQLTYQNLQDAIDSGGA